MEQQEKRTRAANIPEDIMLDIMVRNPVRDIANMRCAKKSLYYSTYESTFVYKHLEFSKKNPILLLSFYSGVYERQHFCYLDEQGPIIDVFKKELFNRYGSNDVLPPCNGLIYFPGFTGSDLYVWNPRLGEFLRLRKSNSMRSRVCSSRYGFGFLSSTKEYKIVNVVHTGGEGFGHEPLQVIRCETMKLGMKSWQVVKETCPCPLSGQRSIFLEDTIYWKVSMSSYNYNLGPVVAFDLVTEKFKMIEHPKIFMQGNGEWPFLGELEGRLCLLDSEPLMPHMMQLWVLVNRETLEWVVVNICHGFERPQMAFLSSAGEMESCSK